MEEFRLSYRRSKPQKDLDEAPTWVCWDIDNCPVPKDCKAEEVVDKIRSALSKLNYNGPISISAYGNMNHIPPSVKKALSSTGIVLNHIHIDYVFETRPSRLHFCKEIWSWKGDNPAPANVLLISCDGGYLPSEMTDLQSKGYNVLLAHPPHSSDSLVASAKTTWLWKNLLKES